MVETMGAGVAIFDYDDDGDEDVFFVDSSPLPGYEGEPPRSRLLRNDRDRAGATRLVDVTHEAGIDVTAYGMGAVAGDIDGDGDIDLYVTGFGANQLFTNQGDGTFRDTTRVAGVGDPLFSASAAMCDTDRDGDLDLYVVNYVNFHFDNNPICGNQEKGVRAYCHPEAFDGVADTFYRNRGDGTFTNATRAAGLGNAAGAGLGVTFSDFDGDGLPDVYVANDMTPNFLFRNRGDGTFEEMGLLAGVALNEQGNPEASMGLAVGDLDNDGKPEIAATHLDTQTNVVYSYLDGWLFVDKRYRTKLAEPSVGKVGFGIGFLDLDQDGALDAAVANGHVIDNIHLIKPSRRFEQPNQIFRNLGNGTFDEVPDAGLGIVRSSRGLAAGDLDGDGDLDLVITNSNDLAEVYENRTKGGRSLIVDLRQAAGNRYAVGAKIEAQAGDTVTRRETQIGSSYLSQHALPSHLGVGTATEVDLLQITWPRDGTRTEIRGLPTGTRIRVTRRP